MTTSIQSLGGKARAANMTPEERTKAARHAATKGARKLGKEGRRLRALKGVATRKARAEAADTLQIKGYLPTPLTYGAAIPPGDARRLQFNLAPSDRNAHLEASHRGYCLNLACKYAESLDRFGQIQTVPHRECAEAIGIARPKRQEPKPGTLNARVLSVMRRAPGRLLWRSEDIEAAVVPCQKVGNALSSLRSAGHVVSEPKPGSRREKLWRLA